MKYQTELTANEVKLVTAIRSLKSFEEVIISADKYGKIDNYIVKRSFKEDWIAE